MCVWVGVLGETPRTPQGLLKYVKFPLPRAMKGTSPPMACSKFTESVRYEGATSRPCMSASCVNLACRSSNISNPVLARLALSQQGWQGAVSGGSLCSFISVAPLGLGWKLLSESRRSHGETPRDHELPPSEQEESLPFRSPIRQSPGPGVCKSGVRS